MSKVIREGIYTEVNADGEVQKEIKTSTSIIEPEPEYVKLYLADILYFQDLPKGYDNILFQIIKRARYAGTEYGMEVTLTKTHKERIAQELGIKRVSSIDNAISKLTKGHILIRSGRGVYQLNPFFFGKGNWVDIKRLRLKLDYDLIEGKTFAKVVHEYQEQAEAEVVEQNFKIDFNLTEEDTYKRQIAENFSEVAL